MSEIQIGFHTMHIPWPWLRQTPGGSGVVAGCRFVLNPPIDTACDWLVVYDDLAAPIRTDVPQARRLCVISEPPAVKTYPAYYLNQFGHVISPYPVAGYRGNLVRSHSALPWHFGVDRQTGVDSLPTHEAFAQLTCPAKQPGLSVVCSDKAITPEHQRRLQFLARLKATLGDEVIHFGRGFQAINDKADAILPYPFHLVLENNRQAQGWTEKLADAYLGWAFPLFSGGPGLAVDFPDDAFVAVDLDDHDAALATIVQVLKMPGFYAARLSALTEARRRVLEEHNLFIILERTIAALSMPLSPRGQSTMILPRRQCSLRRRLRARLLWR